MKKNKKSRRQPPKKKQNRPHLLSLSQKNGLLLQETDIILMGTVDETASTFGKLGGTGVAVHVDHAQASGAPVVFGVGFGGDG